MKKSPVVNVADAEFTRELMHGERFHARIAPISSQIGAKRLGYNITAVPPGKRAFPFHNHHANEEMFFILSGSGELRFGTNTYPVREGDVIGCPPGGPDVAHQLINTSADTELRYLAVSTAIDTDIFQYPDSGKFGAVGGRHPGSTPLDATFSGWFDESQRLDYWHKE